MKRTAPYGQLNSTTVGGGPVCVKPWKDGDNNGGATAQGVTKTSIKVVAVVPNQTQLDKLRQTGGATATRRADRGESTWVDAFHDLLLAQMVHYETWGRDIEVKVVTSSGDDEAAQRADTVAIKAEKPFAVIDLVSNGLDVLDADLAREKILVYGSATTAAKALAQAPYRWGTTDSQAVAVNAAEVIGKQLVGKKAEFAGAEDLQDAPRKFGAVYIDSVIDIEKFKVDLKGSGGTLVSENSYPSNGSTQGNAPTDEFAPVMVTKLKSAGVTTVILFTDTSMTKALMEQATKQEWFPEWFLTGTVFQDISILARTYPPEQAQHTFGISSLFPWVLPDPVPPPPQKSLSVLTEPLNWYWGEGAGSTAAVIPSMVKWLLDGIHSAGPDLTTKTFRQGLFSMPAMNGAAQGYPVGLMTGYGRTPGLPYDEYLSFGLDFSPVWWDPDTTGPSAGTGTEGKGITWYADAAKRYKPGTAPKKQFGWFDESKGVFKYDTRPTPTPEYAGDCKQCPSATGAQPAGAPSSSGFIARANGAGSTALQ